MRRLRNRGQAMVIIAVAFLGLVSFLGLAVDTGILLSHIGHLRRAVDASSIAAANQYRRSTTAGQLVATVREMLELNGINPTTAAVDVRVCDLPAYPPDLSSLHDPALCKESNPWDYDRKLVQVKVTSPVDLAFLRIIGLSRIDLKAEAISEAASVDLVLVLDTSTSMDDAGDPATCKPRDPGGRDCQPFTDVIKAALGFVDNLYYPYDHISVIHFDAAGYKPEDIGYPAGTWFTASKTVADNAIQNLEVFEQAPCYTLPNPGGCLSTNVQEGLLQGGSAFFNEGRKESLWVVVLLSDGAANQARADINDDGSVAMNEWVCPYQPPGAPMPNPTWIQPYCRDGQFSTRHSPAKNKDYDVNDATMDIADTLGCLSDINPDFPGSWCQSQGITNGYEALIYTIGMGPQVVSDTCHSWYDGSTPDKTCDPDMGEQLLRYIAAVGDDGNPTTNPCAGAPQGNDCGNYFHAPDPSDLPRIFNTIANKIYTRITQ